MPDGRRPEPGGWNRIHLLVDDIASEVDRLRAAGVSFRSEIVTGPGGAQIVFDDPSGNPVELFEPLLVEARLTDEGADGAAVAQHVHPIGRVESVLTDPADAYPRSSNLA